MALSERQRRFCEHYAADPNATKAAEAAGYSEKTAYSQGQRLLKNAEVREYLEELQEDAEGERVADMKEVKAFWTSTMRDIDAKTADRLKASELLAKSAGAFTEKVELDVADPADSVVIYLPEKKSIEECTWHGDDNASEG